MKKLKPIFRTTLLIALFIGSMQSFNSCKKDDPAPSIGDVVDTEGADNLNSALESAATLDDLPEEVTTAAVAASSSLSEEQKATFNNVDYNEVVSFYESNVTLSSDEINELKANDVYTFNQVISRMSELPSFISQSELDAIQSNLQGNSNVSAYLIKSEEVPSGMYENNYHKGVTDYQEYINTYTIPAFKKIAQFKAAAEASTTRDINQKSATLEFDINALWGLVATTLSNGGTQADLFTVVLTDIHEGGTGS